MSESDCEQALVCINPTLDDLEHRYNALLVEAFGDTAVNGMVSSERWEQKCLDRSFDANILIHMCRVRHVMLQLYYLDMFAKGKLDSSIENQYVVIADHNPPSVYYATEEAAMEAAFALDLSPPVLFVTRVGSTFELYNI